ncbi:MAG: aldehyde dehydrogenase family protein, partial [Rhodospirillales bacterium]
MTQQFPLMVPGAKGGAGAIEVSAPFDGETIAAVATADASVVETALATAEGLFADRQGWLPAHRRVEILDKACDIMVG